MYLFSMQIFCVTPGVFLLQAEDVIRDKLVTGFQFFFFFQAEDGIRDKLVTGVQCALPIWRFCSRWPALSPLLLFDRSCSSLPFPFLLLSYHIYNCSTSVTKALAARLERSANWAKVMCRSSPFCPIQSMASLLGLPAHLPITSVAKLKYSGTSRWKLRRSAS